MKFCTLCCTHFKIFPGEHFCSYLNNYPFKLLHITRPYPHLGYLCVCVCVRERDREVGRGEGEGNREREGERDRDRDTHTENLKY